MRLSRPTLLFLAFLAVAGCNKPTETQGQTAQAPAPAGQTTVVAIERSALGAAPNVTKFGDLYFAGQPTPDDFAAIKAAGVGGVINLRTEAEMGGFDEKAAVGATGMSYASVPFNGPAGLTDEVFGSTRELLKAVDGPTLLHCASANRVGAVWIPFRVLDQGIDLEQAVAEAKAIGMRTAEYETKARDYVARNR